MKIEDIVLLLSGSAALYLGLKWWQSRTVQPALMRVVNPASPFAYNGRPFTNPLPAPTVNDRYPTFNVLKNPPGFTWNDESEAYVKKDSENTVELLYA